MTNVRQLDLTKRIVDVKQIEQGDDEVPLYKATYIDGTWVRFYVEVVDESRPMTPEEFTNSTAPNGTVELP